MSFWHHEKNFMFALICTQYPLKRALHLAMLNGWASSGLPEEMLVLAPGHNHWATRLFSQQSNFHRSHG
jgi:hypothetical protein